MNDDIGDPGPAGEPLGAPEAIEELHGSPEKAPSRRSGRERRRSQFLNLHVSVKKAQDKWPELAEGSALAEVRELWERGVLFPVALTKFAVMSERQRKRVLKSFLFFKEKFKTDGTLARLKARLVANGAMQKWMGGEDKSSPTVKIESVLMMLAIAASERRHMVAIDIGNAYLEADMSGEEVLMELDPFCVRLLLKIAPQLLPYVDSRGKMVCRLDKALYGCVQSAKLWYGKMKQTLLNLGFIQNDYDQCVFNKIIKGKQITVGLYVDDLLVTCVDKVTIERFISDLKMAFKEVKVSEYDKF